jgi:hypothetical protein
MDSGRFVGNAGAFSVLDAKTGSTLIAVFQRLFRQKKRNRASNAVGDDDVIPATRHEIRKDKATFWNVIRSAPGDVERRHMQSIPLLTAEQENCRDVHARDCEIVKSIAVHASDSNTTRTCAPGQRKR